MEILIQTRKSIYHISREGIKKVATVNWYKVKAMFDRILKVRSNLIEGNLASNPAVKQLDAVVQAGFTNSHRIAVNEDAVRRYGGGTWEKK